MKKILITLICIFSINRANAQNVNIPDANFKAALLANTAINTNADTDIQVSEAIAYTGNIVVSNLNIGDLTGIEAFTNITNLDCSGNLLTSLDFTANTALINLYCSNNNQLTNLDVSGCTALVELFCGFNQLISLDVTENTALTKLYCYFNSLTSLDVTANTALLELNCMFNQLTNLDVIANTALTFLHCGVNQLTSIDVTANTALTYLDCSGNQLPSLNITANTALTDFYCDNNQLTSIDVTANTALQVLDCSENPLTSLNVTANTALSDLYCNNNQLTSLDVTANTALGNLECNGNQLTSLDVSVNTTLAILDCSGNQLTSLNVKNNNNINFEDFYADNNPNLNCIQVDDSTWSANNWTAIDPWAHFSTMCFTCVPIIINPVSSQTVCDSTAFIVSAIVSGGSGTLNYNWNNGSMDTTALTFTIYPQATSTYTLTVTDSTGCTADSNITITVNPLPTVTLVLPSTDTLLCISANPITLTGATPVGGIYSGAGLTGNSFNPSTAGLGSHTIIYSYTDVNTCSNTATSSITVDACSGINETLNNNLFSIYPNPTSGLFTILLSSDTAEIIVTNMLGQQVIKTQTAQNIANLHLDYNGVYIVYLKTKQGTITQKLIVNH